jgi:hypothetical protein
MTCAVSRVGNPYAMMVLAITLYMVNRILSLDPGVDLDKNRRRPIRSAIFDSFVNLCLLLCLILDSCISSLG